VSPPSARCIVSGGAYKFRQHATAAKRGHHLDHQCIDLRIAQRPKRFAPSGTRPGSDGHALVGNTHEDPLMLMMFTPS